MSDLLSRAKEILLPIVTDEGTREELLIDAFYLQDPLLHEIEFTGAAGPFTSKLIKKLLDYGFLPDGTHSLARFLLTARSRYGVDKHQVIDDLVNEANSWPKTQIPQRQDAISALSPGQEPIQTINVPRGDRRPTVFISYSRNDEAFAGKLMADLNTAGHACWIDTSSIKGGDEWLTAIGDGILNSYAFVLVATRAALESRWVQDEIIWARMKNKLIIPLLLEDVTGERGFFSLASYQGIHCFDGGYAIALHKLLVSLPNPTISGAGNEAEPSAQVHYAPRKSELAYLDRLRLEELLNTEKYISLSGSSQRQVQKRAEMRAVFELLSIGKGPREQTASKKFDDAVAEIRRIRRAVLLGEPGGGKTTTIWKLAADLVSDAIADRKAPIPLLIRLGRWTDPEQPLTEYIASQLGDLGDSLDVLFKENRAALLLDGLNELPAGQRDVKYPQVKLLIEEHPDLLAIVSCRKLDYTVDLGFDRINITPLDPLRIREFTERYLGAKTGAALFWKLAGARAREYHNDFLRKVGQEREIVFWLADHRPQDLKWTDDWDTENKHSNWEEWIRHRESPSGLMVLARNPYMLLMLASVYADQNELPENRGELFRLFVETLLTRERIPIEEQASLSKGLAKVAYEMQIRRSDDHLGDALTVLPKETVEKILDDRLLYLAGSASILSVGEQVRFTHQLLQEYFAARYMDLEIIAGRLKATELWPQGRWWERTNWEEATILLAGLYSNNSSRIVEWVAEANPEVAAMCVERSGASLDKTTAEGLKSKWIARLTDLKGDPKPKARAAVGRALGITGWDNRSGVSILNGQNGTALPDIDWVEIPAGEFLYGDESESAAKPQKLILPPFYMSRNPITYSQFQTFLDDPEGFSDQRWFEGLAAGDEDRRMEEQDFKFSNHPRDTVNWYQAMAFCRWFSWRLGGEWDLKKVDQWAVRLPTEFEWEKAARGTDGRIYPYKGEYDTSKCNTDRQIRQTSAVGIYPNGASWYGLMDMAGNVWEWCLSSFKNPMIESQKEKLSTKENRVLRGGSWAYFRMFARAVYRGNNRPADRNNVIGFRLLCCVRPPSL